MTETSTETHFWRYWLFGLLLFAAMIALNPTLSTSVSPMGISDHQTAGTAAKVDAIQQAWKAAGVLLIARASMLIDLFSSVCTVGVRGMAASLCAAMPARMCAVSAAW